MFGKVTYARSRYLDEHGRNRYPADEILGIPKRKRLTTDVFLWFVARAARDESDERVAEEAADVLYHLVVLLAGRGLSLADAYEVLNERRG